MVLPPGFRLVVVGAGSAVGRAVTAAARAEGASVVLAEADPRWAAELAAEHEGDGGRVAVLPGPSWTEAGIDRLVAECGRRWDGVDGVLNCSGRLDDWPEELDSPDRWREVVDENLLGPVFTTRALAPLLRRSEVGSVVLLGSIDGLYGNPRFPAYSVTKGGLVAATHLLAGALAPSVRVNLVATALVFHGAPPPGDPAEVAAAMGALAGVTPLGRVPTAEEVAGTVLFLLSPASSYVTGTVLRCDGGRCSLTPGTGPVVVGDA